LAINRFTFVANQSTFAMSFLGKIIVGLAGAKLIDEAERRHDQRVQQREQRRRDSLFWQDAARRGSAAWQDDTEEGW
jgi:hypothetical protein